MGALRARRGLLPWALLAPGLIFLGIFFLVPLYYMAEVSLQEGTLEEGYRFTWAFDNYSNAISDFSDQFIRSFVYGGTATLAALLIAYPVSYTHLTLPTTP